MFYLIITILMNVIISAIFKLFPKYDINALQAIVVNYWVCVITGCIYIRQVPFTAANFHAPWFSWALLLGLVFIALFRLIAYNTRIHGITTTTIANKLSLVIPVLFSFFLYNEQAGIGKITGIILAFPAIYLASREKNNESIRHNLFWPALLFIGSGLLDTSLKYVQHQFLSSAGEQAVFSIYVFAIASLTGLVLVLSSLASKGIQLQKRNIIAGICVGIPNYFSIYFLIRTLHSCVLQSSAAIPAINIGILVLSSIVAIIFFGERANPLRITGLALAIIAILLITIGDKWRI